MGFEIRSGESRAARLAVMSMAIPVALVKTELGAWLLLATVTADF
jgi:hypothetical protein